MKYQCPACHKILKASGKEAIEKAPFFPFCSERCKLIDLGAWLDAEYRIASKPQPEESGESFNDIPPASNEQ